MALDPNKDYTVNDMLKEDGVKAKAFLKKLDPIDEMQAQDGKQAMAFLKKLLEEERDPQSVEDGQRLFAALKKIFGMAPKAPDVEIASADAMEMPKGDAVVDTDVLAGPLPDLKNFLIKKSSKND